MTIRARFNLDLATLDQIMMLIHGPYSAGKTHLQGDFLRWAKEHGPVAFINIKGEDGHASISGMALGAIGYTVETLADYDSLLDQLGKEKLSGLAIDSLSAYYRFILMKFLGTIRYPDPKIDGERAKMLWGQISLAAEDGVKKSRYVAPYVLWVSPYDKSDDPVSGGKGQTPDLPGKLAYGCAGWFDFVGHITAQTLNPTNVQRKVSFAPTSAILTRQRITTPLTQDITIPTDRGGWYAIFAAMQAAMLPKSTNKKEPK